MLQVKDQWISLDGIRFMEMIPAYKSNSGKCELAITYAFDNNKTFIQLESGYEEYEELAQMIAAAVNNKA